MRIALNLLATVICGGLMVPLPQAASQAQERSAPRVIAPELIAPPPVEAGELQRTEPRAPLSPLGGPAPEPRKGRNGNLYFRPMAIAAGMFESEGRIVTIKGIRIVNIDQRCDAADGGVWACGLRARTAFRYWLRGRAVDCGPKQDDAGTTGDMPRMTLSCSLAGYDIGKWLTENGWALAEPGGPYEAESDAARAGRKGIFGDGPLQQVSGSD